MRSKQFPNDRRIDFVQWRNNNKVIKKWESDVMKTQGYTVLEILQRQRESKQPKLDYSLTLTQWLKP